MSLEKFLTENNMEENMKIVFEILKNKDKIMESYCEAIVEKHRKQIESKGFEIVKTDKNRDKLGKWKHHDLSYPFMIKSKDCGEYYYAFCVEYYMQEKRYVNYGVKFFKQDSILNTKDTLLNRIQKFLELKESWWLNYDKRWCYSLSTSIAELESKLQEFLDSNKIKALNEKLKEYQA